MQTCKQLVKDERTILLEEVKLLTVIDNQKAVTEVMNKLGFDFFSWSKNVNLISFGTFYKVVFFLTTGTSLA